MNNLEERVGQLFEQSIEIKISAADTLAREVARAGTRLINCLLNDGKILVCGNGGSAANCFHFSTAMVSHFEVERPPLPVIALNADQSLLTAISKEGLHADQIFARQIHGLGQENDVLLVLSTSGNVNNILHAVNAANDRGMDTIALTGGDGGILANHLGPEDIELRVQTDNPTRVREIHLFILHCFCDLIDQALFSQSLG